MRKIVFSCQNNQELEDLSLVAVDLKANHNAIPVLYDVSGLMGEDFDPAVVGRFSIHYSGVEVFKKKFNELSAGKKLLVSLVNALNLLRVCLKERSRVCIIGVPLLVYRLASFLGLGQLTMISYIRGIIAQSGDETSLSSKLYRRFGWLCVGPLKRIVSDYYADKVICIGRVTHDFVTSRRVPERNVKVVGSVYCDSRLEVGTGEKICKAEKKEIIFLSSAFAAHGYIDSQSAQTKLALNILEYLNSNFSPDEFRFVVRKHPRESADNYQEVERLGGVIDSGGLDAIVSYAANACFLSPVSTLLFELAYLGRSVALVADEHFLSRHAEWYSRLNASPMVDWRVLVLNIMRVDEAGKVYGFELNDIIDTKNKGRVVAEFSKLVMDK